jgi:hypothetical protein
VYSMSMVALIGGIALVVVVVAVVAFLMKR